MIVSPDQEQEQEKNAYANRCENDAWHRSTRHHLMRGGNERHPCYNRGAYK